MIRSSTSLSPISPRSETTSTTKPSRPIVHLIIIPDDRRDGSVRTVDVRCRIDMTGLNYRGLVHLLAPLAGALADAVVRVAPLIEPLGYSAEQLARDAITAHQKQISDETNLDYLADVRRPLSERDE